MFIKKNIHLIEYGKFNRIIHSKEFEENHSKLKEQAKMWCQSPPEAPVFSRTPEMN